MVLEVTRPSRRSPRELDRAVTVDEVRPPAREALAEVFDLTLEKIPADEGHGLWSQPIHGQLAGRQSGVGPARAPHRSSNPMEQHRLAH